MGFFLPLILIWYSSSIGGIIISLKTWSLLTKARLSRGMWQGPSPAPWRSKMQSDACRCDVLRQHRQGDAVAVQGASHDLWWMVNPAREREVWWGQVTSRWVTAPFGGCGTLLRLEYLCSCHFRGQQWKNECIFLLHNFYPSHECIHLHTLSSFPAQNCFHTFSLLHSNCFYTVFNTPQVPSVHNCCYLVKCFP